MQRLPFYSLRVKMGLFLVISFAMLSITDLSAIKQRFGFSVDLATRYEKLFAGLKEILPPNGIVGYVTDKKFEIVRDIDKDWQSNYIELIAEYCLIQYILSPTIIENSLNHALIIGNFHESINIGEFCARNNLVLIKDFGEGVMLFKREN